MPSATTLLPDRPQADATLLTDRAEFVRTEAIRLIELAKVGHYSSVFSAAEIFSALYYGVMRIDPARPGWADRDRFLMGKGHAAVGLFPILADLGYFSTDVLNTYTRLGSPLGDHPDMTKVPGIDFSSGSIGHALSNGLGMALGGRMSGRDFSVFVMLGDGEMQEGQVWEAALAGAHHRLGKLVAIVDRNGFQLDGSVDDVIGIEPLADKWRAFGWQVHEVDGHDAVAVRDLLRVLAERPDGEAPSCVVAHTKKGKGVAYMEEDPGWHLGYLVPADAAAAVAEIREGARA